jgi:hydroxyacylglutathione hydrolase
MTSIKAKPAAKNRPQSPILFGDGGANAFLVPVPEGYLAVDPGSPAVARQMVAYVQSRGEAPSQIKLATATHLHLDHISGLPELQRLTGCEIRFFHQAARFGRRAVTALRGWSAQLRAAGEELLSGHRLSVRHLLRVRRPFRITGWFGNGEVLPGGWEVIYTPGHTRESICLYNRHSQVLLAGDTLVGKRGGLYVNPFHEDAEVLNLSLLTLERLRVSTIYPGHGRPAHGQLVFEKALNRHMPVHLERRM